MNDTIPVRPTRDFIDPDLDDFLELGGPRRIAILINLATGALHIAHDCKTIDLDSGPIQLRIAPALSERHAIASNHPLRIRPSIACDDCGLHGFITNDEWTDA